MGKSVITVLRIKDEKINSPCPEGACHQLEVGVLSRINFNCLGEQEGRPDLRQRQWIGSPGPEA